MNARRSVYFLCALVAVATLNAQTTPAPQDLNAAWESLLAGTIQTAAPDPVLTQQQSATTHGDDFLDHVFFESRSIFEREHSSFRDGVNTITNVVNAPDNGVFNPAGIPYPQVFQPDANRIDEFLDFGTRGWLNERINTHFAFRYRQDLTKVDNGAPAEDLLAAFNGNREILFLDGTLEINGKPTDGFWRDTTVQVGRLNVYGAELAQLDGGLFTIRRKEFDFTVYGGRRYSFFSDPVQRAIGGANLTWKPDPNTSLELESLLYIRASHRIVLRRRIHDRWLAMGGFRFYGGSPTDFNGEVVYSGRNNRDTLRVSFTQKITNKDYNFDYTIGATDQSLHNPLTRLYFGILPPYSQVNIEEHHQFSSRLRAGGSVVVRRLTSSSDNGPYDTSFEDYRANLQVFPLRKTEVFFEYHQRNSDRLSPLTTTTLDNLQATGETSVKDLELDLRRNFGEGRLSLSAGGYYRHISLQDAFYYINGQHQSGFLAGGSVRLDRHTRASVDYGLDNAFFLFTPDLKNSQILRVGMTWKY